MSDDLDGGPGYLRFSSRTFREAALVALIPALGSAVAYAFALGRANDLGIPDQLIAVSLPDVFRSFAAVTAFQETVRFNEHQRRVPVRPDEEVLTAAISAAAARVAADRVPFIQKLESV
jgi:hypothetical protein